MHILEAAVALSAVSIIAAFCWIYKRGARQRKLRRKRQAAASAFQVGNPFEFEHVYRSILLNDEYKMLDRQFLPDDVIIDVGAHIGAFTYLCHTLGSRAIYSFEPSQRNFEFLQRNAGALSGVHLEGKAVWRSDRGQETQLMLSGPDKENTGACSVLAAGRIVDFPTQALIDSSGGAAPVAAVALDEVLKRFERVKLLKLDCEGSEFPILLTSRELGRVQEIVGEVHELDEAVQAHLDPEGVVQNVAYRLDALVSRLEALGFVVLTRRAGDRMFLLKAIART